jgi:hypothetical protein
MRHPRTPKVIQLPATRGKPFANGKGAATGLIALTAVQSTAMSGFGSRYEANQTSR